MYLIYHVTLYDPSIYEWQLLAVFGQKAAIGPLKETSASPTKNGHKKFNWIFIFFEKNNDTYNEIYKTYKIYNVSIKMITPQETFCQLKLATIYHIVFFWVSFFYMSSKASKIHSGHILRIQLNKYNTISISVSKIAI